MSKILVVDDLRIFTDYPGEITYARTLNEGLTEILLGSWDEIFLDHDLGGDSTIRPLVMMLAQQGFDGEPLDVGTIYVCSDNPAGRDWIIGTLQNYYDVSFKQPQFRVDYSTPIH